MKIEHKNIICPGCKSSSWMVCFNTSDRITLDCNECQYRLSFPLDVDRAHGTPFKGMPLEYGDVKPHP